MKFLKLIATLALAAVLAACGGGGGSSEQTPVAVAALPGPVASAPVPAASAPAPIASAPVVAKVCTAGKMADATNTQCVWKPVADHPQTVYAVIGDGSDNGLFVINKAGVITPIVNMLKRVDGSVPTLTNFALGPDSAQAGYRLLQMTDPANPGTPLCGMLDKATHEVFACDPGTAPTDASAWVYGQAAPSATTNEGTYYVPFDPKTGMVGGGFSDVYKILYLPKDHLVPEIPFDFSNPSWIGKTPKQFSAVNVIWVD